MKEPCFTRQSTGEQIPYSQAPIFVLQRIGEIRISPNPEHPECYDQDFRRRYAAILLKERGL